ncbi:MAG: hypothetical protein HY438_00415 [DPANN group archaeon]|nr:hypothetical protein [DPANN group archaeon]
METPSIQLAKAKKILHGGMYLPAKEDRLKAFLDAKVILEELVIQSPANSEAYHDLGVVVFVLSITDDVQGDNILLERCALAIHYNELAIQYGYCGDGGCAREHITQILRSVSALAQNKKNSEQAKEILDKFLPKYGVA